MRVNLGKHFFQKKELVSRVEVEAEKWFLSIGNKKVAELSLLNESKSSDIFFMKKGRWKKFNKNHWIPQSTILKMDRSPGEKYTAY